MRAELNLQGGARPSFASLCGWLSGAPLLRESRHGPVLAGDNRLVRIGDVLRYGKPKDPGPPEIKVPAYGKPGLPLVDKLPNFWHVTATPGATRAQLEKGIDAVRKVPSPSGRRVPAILISSSPHKAGSEVTPWHDSIDPDVGYALYYGDSKADHDHAPDSDGNKELLSAFSRHSSPDRDARLCAEPLILFERVPWWNGTKKIEKGFVRFAGIAIVEHVRLLTQVDAKTRRPFANYVFELLIFDLAYEGEQFSWDWISARRSEVLSNEQCLKLAPQSWKAWVKDGKTSYPTVRRSVARAKSESTSNQLPEPGSKEAEILDEIFDFYEGAKHRFEAVAELVAESVLNAGAPSYRPGWISRRGHDYGIDFVGRLDIGDGFARTSLIVLGQAKCERNATNGKDIARTVARLQRGWFGCYVTTSFFSKPLQQEIIEDKYPLALIHGLRVAQEVQRMAGEQGLTTRQLLEKIDETYLSRLDNRRPEEVLLL